MLEHSPGHLQQLGATAPGAARHPLQLRPEFTGAPLHQGTEDPLLALEVVVERPRRHPGAPRDVGHLGVGEPTRAEDLLGRVEDGRTEYFGELPAQGCAPRHGPPR